MTFIKELIKSAKPTWEACYQTPFVKDMIMGCLDESIYINYLKQDTYYLEHYAKMFGKAIYLSENMTETALFGSVINFVVETELLSRKRFLNHFNISLDAVSEIPLHKETKAYVNHIMTVAETGSITEILMCALPCLLSYKYIGERALSHKGIRDNPYWQFISEYANEAYFSRCNHWVTFAETKCFNLDDVQQSHLAQLFRESNQYELKFWQAVYDYKNSSV